MRPFLCFSELENRSSHDDFASVFKEIMQDPLEVQHLRSIVDQRQHIDAERRFERRMLVEVV